MDMAPPLAEITDKKSDSKYWHMGPLVFGGSSFFEMKSSLGQ